MVEMERQLVLCIILWQAVTFCSIEASNETLTDEAATTLSPPEQTEPELDYDSKHESFVNCPKFELNPGEYVLFPNGTVFVEVYNKTYTEEFYILYGDALIICIPMNDDAEDGDSHRLSSESMHLLTAIGIGVSMVCLLLHLVVFALVSDLQNLPGCNLASLCTSLFLSYLFMIVASFEEVTNNKGACVAVAGMIQFFFMASFLWMFIIAFAVFRSILQATGNLRISSRGFKVKRYIYNSLVSWGISGLFTAAAMTADNVDFVEDSFKPHFDEICWFKHKQSLLTFFAGPVFTLICINFLLFGVSAYNIFANRLKSTQDSQKTNLRKTHWVYLRLAVIMGVTWINGALAPLVNAMWLWYLFAALNTFQGFFIFVAFTCTSKVKSHFRLKLLGGRSTSNPSLTPTFQSYCNYSNSIEKDLNEVVDSKDKSDVIDTVVIHL